MQQIIDTVLNFIDGEFCTAASGKTIENVNPATGQCIGTLPSSQEADVQRAVLAAEAAFPRWRALSIAQRCDYLERIANELEFQAEDFALAESRDQGKPLLLAKQMDIPRCIENFRYFARCARLQGGAHLQSSTQLNSHWVREPCGVAGLITPWNLPLYLLTWKLAPALAMGNTVVCKPSEFTSTTAFLLAGVLRKIGLPAGVYNIVFGSGLEAGNALVSHPKVPLISFTGGTETGKKIALAAAPHFKKVSLELGGKNPALVFADAHFQLAVEGCVRSAFLNQGEICLCTSRIYIEECIFDKFVEAFVAETKKWIVGDPLANETKIGALIHEDHLKKVEKYVTAATTSGARIVVGGQRACLPRENARGFFYQPTALVNVENSAPLQQEEVFGPVVTLTPFSNCENALQLANHSRYGLCAAVWTNSLQRANECASRLECGTVWINTWLARDLSAPFGGKKQSGIGREGGTDSLDFFSEKKTIGVQIS